ncbi:thioesterase domain-containing protein [Kitasatospora sp. NBC_01287]|uniref:thioesterase II family protein n=1 Tax=Kitasatospora sp. NBC_01287 TaxID=2903573 RepID=UPI0022586D54|nr:thioesterase domain-containing protein [Kitasatospora sp. NBC_01287]MCX4750475.1 thioesterase domain-containing protein [Kitasatospora sp. NBC_01287]
MTAAIERTRTGPWLPFTDPAGGVRLYCLPHAGGAASAFRPWLGRLDGVSVRPLQPPGRESRARETPHVRMGPLVAELAEVVLGDARDAPYAVYGHSLGALVGFELIHEIRRLGGPPPVRFLVSGCSAPQWPDEPGDPFTTTDPEIDMTDNQIVALLRLLGGTPEQFLSNPMVLRMILPAIRADLAVKCAYRYEPRPPLEVPITTIAGRTDPRAGVASIAAWREQTVRRFQAHVLHGGHFAALEQLDATLGHIGRALAGARDPHPGPQRQRQR